MMHIQSISCFSLFVVLACTIYDAMIQFDCLVVFVIVTPIVSTRLTRDPLSMFLKKEIRISKDIMDYAAVHTANPNNGTMAKPCRIHESKYQQAHEFALLDFNVA